MPKAKVNGFTMYYEVAGPSTGPWLTFSNSLRLDHTMWWPQVAEFCKDFRVLTYDVRGHGNSSATPGFYTLAQLADDVVGLWDHLGVQKSHFCGLSLGGITAMQLGIAHGNRIDRLAVCDCRGDSPPDQSKQWADRRILVAEKGLEALVAGSIDPWFNADLKKTYADSIKALAQTIRETSLEGYNGCTGALAGGDQASHVGKIKNKTMYLVGSEDGAFPPLMEQMHKDTPGSTYVVIPGATHVSNLTHPKEFNAALRDFLTK